MRRSWVRGTAGLGWRRAACTAVLALLAALSPGTSAVAALIEVDPCGTPGDVGTWRSEQGVDEEYLLVAVYVVAERCVEHWLSESRRDTALVTLRGGLSGVSRVPLPLRIVGERLWIDDFPGVALGSDITNDGLPNLVIGVGSATACCNRVIVLDLSQELRVLHDDFVSGPAGHPDAIDRSLVDLDADADLELIAIDHVDLERGCGTERAAPLRVRTVFRYDANHGRFVEASAAFPEAFAGDVAAARGVARTARDAVGVEARLCRAVPLVLALVSAGRLAEAWEAFDGYVVGPGAAEQKAWLQHMMLTRLPWRHQPSLRELSGVWTGELAQFVRDPVTGEFDLMGGGSMIEIELLGDAPIGWPVGIWRNFGRGDRETICTLRRGADGPHHLHLQGDCENPIALHLQLLPNGELGFAYFFDGGVHEDLRYEGYAVRGADPTAETARHAPPLAGPEQLFASSCLGLQLSRNEVFARRGWVFGSGAVADHFASQPWYRPRGDLTNRNEVNAAVVDELTRAERVDAQTLLAFERYVGCSGSRHPDPTLRRGPSFSCAAPTRWDEQLICASAPLSELDALVAAIQAEVATSLPGQENAVAKGEKAWVSSRSACEAAENQTACVRQAYHARFEELRGQLVAP